MRITTNKFSMINLIILIIILIWVLTYILVINTYNVNIQSIGFYSSIISNVTPVALGNKYFKNLKYVIKSDKSQELNFKLIRNYYLLEAFNEFKTIILKDLDTNQLFSIIFKIELNDGRLISIAPLFRSSNETKAIKNLLNIFKSYLDTKSNVYDIIKITNIIFSYHIYDLSYNQLVEGKDPFDINLADKLDKKALAERKKEIRLDIIKEKESIKYIDWQGFKLPLDFDLFNSNFLKLNKNFTFKYSLDIEINESRTKYSYIIRSLFNKKVIFRFTDELINTNTMKRTISKLFEFIIDLNNKTILYETRDLVMDSDRNYFSKIYKDEHLINNFLTVDLETYGLNADDSTQLVPFLFSIYKENELAETFLINETNKLGDILLKYLLIYKYNKHVIYAHNLSSFDGIYILNSLIKISEISTIKVEPMFRDRKLLQIKVSYGYRTDQNRYRYHVYFRDSYLLLLTSLDKLSKTFLIDQPELMKMTDNGKNLINQVMSLNQDEINSMLKNNEFIQNFKDYCLNDSIALYHILLKFNDLIFNRYMINIHKYPTLPSLAFAIYKTDYMKHNINKINGDINSFIRKSYTGGHVDVYALYSNKLTFLYDVVSLYPTVMSKFKLPMLLLKHFKGNPLDANLTLDYLNSDSISSFIKCDIYVDHSINRPVYQTHINNKSMCATGLFKDQVVFLPELLEYSKLTNNKIRIIEESITEGYIFKCENIFNEYISSLFEIKNSVNKKDPMYLISKILMNSLYGRFGLKPELSKYNLVDNQLIETFILENHLNVNDIIDMSDTNKSLIVSNKVIDTLDINVAIASAITSFARTLMAPLILDEEIPLLYTDTDSYVTEIDLSTTKYKHLIHNNLGGLKLENTFKEFIAIAPKLYGGILTDESSIVKVKGFKNKVEFNTLKEILFDNKKLVLNQSKWFKSFKDGSINIKTNPYTLALNENKRLINLNTLKTKAYHYKSFSP